MNWLTFLPSSSCQRLQVHRDHLTLFTLSDHGIQGPDRLPVGATCLSFSNQGQHCCLVQLLRLAPAEARNPLDLLQDVTAGAADRLPGEWLAEVAELAPGGGFVFQSSLQAGRHLLVCLLPLPEPDGRRGLAGVLKDFTVS